MDHVEAAGVTFTVGDNTDSTQVSATGTHNNVASVKLDVGSDLVGGEVDLDGVVDLDKRVWVTDGSTVVCDDVWDAALTELHLLDLTELVLRLFFGDSVDGESALDVVDETEVFTSLLEGDNIHQTSWESVVGSNLVVDLDELLHEDGLDLTAVESVLQSVSNEDNERKRLSQLVWTSRWSWSIGTRQLVEHPVLWSGETLHVLLRSSGHFVVITVVEELTTLRS